MGQNISKICADALRTFSTEKLGAKIKPAHAHELTAAYFGYRSKNALLADKNYPANNLHQAEIIVMIPDESIDKRRGKLEGLPSNLPDSYTLGEAVYVALFSDEWWKSQHPPFRSFAKAGRYLVENSAAYQSTFNLVTNLPIHHYVVEKEAEHDVTLTVVHAYKDLEGEMIGYGQTTIRLPRVAGRIGFGKPEFSVERWGPGFRRKIKATGVQS